MRHDIVEAQIAESINVKQRILADRHLMSRIAEVAEVCTSAYRQGGQVFFAGNGGSAADAQHLAGEMVSRFYFDRPGIPAHALTTDTSVMTAIGNDYGYEMLFARQLQAQGRAGDIFVGISTSGNSANVVRCLEVCQAKHITSVAIVGARPCQMDGFDYVLHVPSEETPRIQECQTLIGHIICCIVEENLFGTTFKIARPQC